LLLSNYNAVQLFVSIVGLLSASFYFYRLNFLTTNNYLILCFFLFGEETGVLFMEEEALFLFMPTNYMLLALLLTLSGQLFIMSVLLTIFAFAIDQLSRIAADSLFMLYDTGIFSSGNILRWLAVFTILRLLVFMFQGRFYNWFIYKLHILQLTAFFKKKNTFILSILFFVLFLVLKLVFGSPVFGIERFYLTFSSVVFLLIIVCVSMLGMFLSKQKQQLSFYIEKQAEEEFSSAKTSTSPHIKMSVRNYQRIEQMKNHWLKHYLVSVLRNCRKENINIELEVQEIEQIMDDFLMIDAVRCLSAILDDAVKECRSKEKATIKVDLYVESRYIDCQIKKTEDTEKASAKKSDDQAAGLSDVKRILSNYHQGEFYFKPSEKEFTAQFVLKK
jgi:hypothetical protein